MSIGLGMSGRLVAVCKDEIERVSQDGAQYVLVLERSIGSVGSSRAGRESVPPSPTFLGLDLPPGK